MPANQKRVSTTPKVSECVCYIKAFRLLHICVYFFHELQPRQKLSFSDFKLFTCTRKRGTLLPLPDAETPASGADEFTVWNWKFFNRFVCCVIVISSMELIMENNHTNGTNGEDSLIQYESSLYKFKGNYCYFILPCGVWQIDINLCLHTSAVNWCLFLKSLWWNINEQQLEMNVFCMKINVVTYIND